MMKVTVAVGFLLVLACSVLITAEEIPAQDDGLDIPDDREFFFKLNKHSNKQNLFIEMIVHKRPAFFLGSRYGRSDGNSNRKMNPVQRRSFFIGSRYGKRSREDNSFAVDDGALSCVYTGVLNLFECKQI